MPCTIGAYCRNKRKHGGIDKVGCHSQKKCYLFEKKCLSINWHKFDELHFTLYSPTFVLISQNLKMDKF